MCYCCSVAQLCPTLCDPMGCNTPGLWVPHHLPKFAQVHVHGIRDAIQPSHPLMSSSPSALSLSQHQGLYQWVRCSHQVTKILELQLQHQSFPTSIQGWFSFRLTGLISVLRDFQESSPAPQFEGINSLVLYFFIVQLSQPYVTIGKTIALTIWTFVGRAMSLLFNTLSRFVITFLPTSNRLLISWLQSASAMILEPKKRKSVTASTFSPPICHEGMAPDTMILVFLILSFKLALSLSSFTLIKRLFSSSSLSAIRIVSSAYLRLLMFLPPILIPACNSSSPAFLMMCSAYRLSKQNVRRHACHTSISILNQSIVPYRVLTVVSWPTNRFLRSQVMWPGIPISLRIFRSLLWSTQLKVVA